MIQPQPTGHHKVVVIGGGVYKAQRTRRDFRECLPPGARHIAQSVIRLDPDDNQIRLDNDTTLGYDYLVVAAGIQINWNGIKGLIESLGKNGVSSNYSYEYAPYTWERVRAFKGGTAIFHQPAGPVKCPGAPQKARIRCQVTVH